MHILKNELVCMFLSMAVCNLQLTKNNPNIWVYERQHFIYDVGMWNNQRYFYFEVKIKMFEKISNCYERY